MAKKLAQLFGVIFILIGLLGFIGNPIVGEMALFHTDMMHNIVHLLSGVILLVAAAKGASALWLKVFGVVYLVVAVLGFMMMDASGTGSVLGLIDVNGADNWLHLVLAVVFLLGGFAGKKTSEPSVSSPMSSSPTSPMGGSMGQM